MYFCHCPPNYYGKNCQKKINSYVYPSNYCENGGFLTKQNNGKIICNCASSYFGNRCQIQLDPCKLNGLLCYNGGNCLSGGGSWNEEQLQIAFLNGVSSKDFNVSCKCPSGFTGIIIIFFFIILFFRKKMRY